MDPVDDLTEKMRRIPLEGEKRYPNTLMHARRADGMAKIYVSVWLKDLADMHAHFQLFLVPITTVKIPGTDLSVPVAADSCTATFLRSRRVELHYCVLEPDQEVPHRRLTVDYLSVFPAPEGVKLADKPIDLPLEDFVARYLEERTKTILEGPNLVPLRSANPLLQDVKETLKRVEK